MIFNLLVDNYPKYSSVETSLNLPFEKEEDGVAIDELHNRSSHANRDTLKEPGAKCKAFKIIFDLAKKPPLLLQFFMGTHKSIGFRQSKVPDKVR